MSETKEASAKCRRNINLSSCNLSWAIRIENRIQVDKLDADNPFRFYENEIQFIICIVAAHLPRYFPLNVSLSISQWMYWMPSGTTTTLFAFIRSSIYSFVRDASTRYQNGISILMFARWQIQVRALFCDSSSVSTPGGSALVR